MAIKAGGQLSHSPDSQEDERETAVCLCSKEGRSILGCIGTGQCQSWAVLAPQYRRGMHILEQVQQKATKMSKELEHLS